MKDPILPRPRARYGRDQRESARLRGRGPRAPVPAEDAGAGLPCARRARPPPARRPCCAPSCAGSRPPRLRRPGSSLPERPGEAVRTVVFAEPPAEERREILAAEEEAGGGGNRFPLEGLRHVRGQAAARREPQGTGVEHVAVALGGGALPRMEPRGAGAASRTRTSSGRSPLRARARSAGLRPRELEGGDLAGGVHPRIGGPAPLTATRPPPASRASAVSSVPCTVRREAAPRARLALPALEVRTVVSERSIQYAGIARSLRVVCHRSLGRAGARLLGLEPAGRGGRSGVPGRDLEAEEAAVGHAEVDRPPGRSIRPRRRSRARPDPARLR